MSTAQPDEQYLNAETLIKMTANTWSFGSFPELHRPISVKPFHSKSPFSSHLMCKFHPLTNCK